MSSRHTIVNPDALAKPTGFSHAVVAGRTIYLAGQTAQRSDGTIAGETMAQQYDQAAANVVTALRAAGGEPSQLVSMQIFVTDVTEYRRLSKEVGEAYRRHFGRHYPAMALLEVRRLFEPAAEVELMCVAVTA